MKSLLQNRKQSIMMAVIMAAVSFAGAFAVVMFYNTTIDIRAFEETPGIEISNALAVIRPDIESEDVAAKIRRLEDVRKAQFIDQVLVKVDNNDVNVYVMDDYAQKETNTIYEGRYPIHDNEAAVSGHLAEMIEKKIGDSIDIKMGENHQSFVITGLTQGANMGGINASVRSDAIRKLDPDFHQQALQIYLNKDVDTAVFAEKLVQLYGDSLLQAVDMNKEFKNGVSNYTSIVSKVGIAILAVAAAVVLLVLYFVINSAVVRRRRELGIQKAIGFTTFQLMNQVSLGFLPPVIAGVLIGGLIGATQTNAIMSTAQRAMGIMKANYIITPIWIALFGAGVIFVSYLTSLLITSRIRKISAYGLVNE
jgi:putative ABC transport system permease protein